MSLRKSVLAMCSCTAASLLYCSMSSYSSSTTFALKSSISTLQSSKAAARSSFVPVAGVVLEFVLVLVQMASTASKQAVKFVLSLP